MSGREWVLLAVIVGSIALGAFCIIDGPLISVVVCALAAISATASLLQARGSRRPSDP